MRSFAFRLSVLTLLSFFGCAPSVDEKLDEARFALDSGDHAKAIAAAQAVFDADNSNVDAAMVLSAGYALQAGIQLTNIADDLMDIAGGSATDGGDDFRIIRNVMAGIFNEAADLTSLRTAIEKIAAVAPAPTTSHPLYAAYNFQYGVLETLEAFSLPTLRAKPASIDANTDSYDITLITATDRTNIESDFLNADNHLVEAGLGDKDIAEALRQNYWALANASGNTRFSLAELQDITACQLDTDVLNVALQSAATCLDFIFTESNGSLNTN